MAPEPITAPPTSERSHFAGVVVDQELASDPCYRTTFEPLGYEPPLKPPRRPREFEFLSFEAARKWLAWKTSRDSSEKFAPDLFRVSPTRRAEICFSEAPCALPTAKVELKKKSADGSPVTMSFGPFLEIREIEYPGDSLSKPVGKWLYLFDLKRESLIFEGRLDKERELWRCRKSGFHRPPQAERLRPRYRLDFPLGNLMHVPDDVVPAVEYKDRFAAFLSPYPIMGEAMTQMQAFAKKDSPILWKEVFVPVQWRGNVGAVYAHDPLAWTTAAANQFYLRALAKLRAFRSDQDLQAKAFVASVIASMLDGEDGDDLRDLLHKCDETCNVPKWRKEKDDHAHYKDPRVWIDRNVTQKEALLEAEAEAARHYLDQTSCFAPEHRLVELSAQSLTKLDEQNYSFCKAIHCNWTHILKDADLTQAGRDALLELMETDRFPSQIYDEDFAIGESPLRKISVNIYGERLLQEVLKSTIAAQSFRLRLQSRKRLKKARKKKRKLIEKAFKREKKILRKSKKRKASLKRQLEALLTNQNIEYTVLERRHGKTVDARGGTRPLSQEAIDALPDDKAKWVKAVRNDHLLTEEAKRLNRKVEELKELSLKGKDVNADIDALRERRDGLLNNRRIDWEDLEKRHGRTVDGMGDVGPLAQENIDALPEEKAKWAEAVRKDQLIAEEAKRLNRELADVDSKAMRKRAAIQDELTKLDKKSVKWEQKVYDRHDARLSKIGVLEELELKVFTPVAGLFELWNAINAFQDRFGENAKADSARADWEFANSMADLAGYMGDAALTYQGAWLARNSAPSARAMAARLTVTRLAAVVNVVGSVMEMGLHIHSAYDQFVNENNVWAGRAYVAAAVGAGLMAVGGVLMLVNAKALAAAGLTLSVGALGALGLVIGFFLVAGLVLLFVGLILAGWWTYNTFENVVRHSFMGKDFLTDAPPNERADDYNWAPHILPISTKHYRTCHFDSEKANIQKEKFVFLTLVSAFQISAERRGETGDYRVEIQFGNVPFGMCCELKIVADKWKAKYYSKLPGDWLCGSGYYPDEDESPIREVGTFTVGVTSALARKFQVDPPGGITQSENLSWRKVKRKNPISFTADVEVIRNSGRVDKMIVGLPFLLENKSLLVDYAILCRLTTSGGTQLAPTERAGSWLKMSLKQEEEDLCLEPNRPAVSSLNSNLVVD